MLSVVLHLLGRPVAVAAQDSVSAADQCSPLGATGVAGFTGNAA